MDTISVTALERVNKARVRLVLERPFYGVLVSNVEPVISRRFPTAATNGKYHYWNPEFVASLTDDELLGVQVHESEHDARHHGTRRGSRDPFEWNVAGDYSINGDLISEGFVLPKERLFDPRYQGLATEDIFRMRELDKQREQPQPEPEDGDGKSDDDESDDSDHGDCNDDEDTDSGNEPGEDGDEGEAAGKGSESQDSDDTGSDAGDGMARRSESCSGAESRGLAGNAEGDGESEQSGSPDPASSGDVGRCGEVLDNADDATERAESDLDWDKIVAKAVSVAKGRGMLPGHITREIERAKNPPRDWRDELREFCEQGALRIDTWNRPNRRFIGQGLVLPGSQRDGVNKAAFLIDTSGSMDDIALACVRDEAQALLDDGIISEVVVIYGDTVVTRVDEYATGDEIEFDPRGGGGTDMKPLFKYVAENVSDASLIVNYTDLEIGDPGEEPHCPVLFAVHGYPQRVKQLMANAPWGARAIDIGVH